MMKHLIRDYFSFNRRERNGIFILLIIITLLVLFLSLSDLFFSQPKTDFSEFEKEMQEFERQPLAINDSAFSYPQKNAFAKPRHLKDSAISRQHPVPQNNYQAHPLMVELNAADTNALKQLKGIGSVFAKRVIKYRDLLGGFFVKEQLLEVYGFDQEKYRLVENHVRVDTSFLKKININTATHEEMKKHPYVRWKVANVLAAYRSKHGNYSSVKDILKTDVISDSLYKKITPYFCL
jgi:DNA uptake protein ComE-like DNA-binding protein